jgi:hypothetical protein
VKALGGYLPSRWTKHYCRSRYACMRCRITFDVANASSFVFVEDPDAIRRKFGDWWRVDSDQL